MARKCQLVYEYKQSEREVIDSIQPARIQKIKTFSPNSLLRQDDADNMLVFGDNLPVLKALLSNRDVRNKVVLVYIDPPFSTQQEFRSGKQRVSTISSRRVDEIAYEDRLIGADYLEFLRKRLLFLRELLADNGSIYVHIDWKQGHYVKVLMDEVFGQDHFINDIARIKCNPKNFARPGFGNVKDMILFYAKRPEYVWNESKEQMTEEDLQRLFPKVDADGRKYTTVPLHAPGETQNGPTGQEWKGLKPPAGRHWRTHPDELTRLDELGLIEWSSKGNPRKKIYADTVLRDGKKRQDIWEFKDPPYPTYPTEKNAEMLETVIQASSNAGDLVLDCFAGSGATLVCAEELGRRWIGIDNSPEAIAVSLKKLMATERLREFTLYSAGQIKLPKNIQELVEKKSA